MPPKPDPRHCLNCNRPLTGRADKKYCNDQCRNDHNNHLKHHVNNYMRNINNALKRNRHILQELLPDTTDKKTVSKEKMMQQGFQFKYLTHTYTNKKGAVYYFVYDFGYLPLANNLYLLVKKRERESGNGEKE